MELNMDKEYWEDTKCPKYNCKKDACKCGLRKVFLASALGDDSKDSPVAPKNGAYCNAIVVYEANGHIYIYSAEGIPTLVEAGGSDIEEKIEQLTADLADEATYRENADNALQREIDDIKNSPDVVDIVDTYADLQAYDTSHLGDKDIIRVLTDETHDGASSYYRWDKQTETWTYIGSIQMAANTIFYANLSETGNTRHIYKNSDMTGTVSVQELLNANEDGQVILRMSSTQTPENFNDAYLQNTYVGVNDYQFLFLDNRNYYEYDGTATTDTSYYYSKSTIQLELTAGNNITITGNTISATDTTYSNFTGTDGTSAGASGLVPAPATTDAGKFLKADGTWDTTGGGGGDTMIELTTSDFDYPVGSEDGVALWKLTPGIYTITNNNVKVYFADGDSKLNNALAIIIINKTSSGTANILFIPRANNSSTLHSDGIRAYDVSSAGVDNADVAYLRSNLFTQSTGNDSNLIMSQNATTSMVYNDPSAKTQIKIGNGASSNAIRTIAVGDSATASQSMSMALGNGATANGERTVALGVGANTGNNFASVALGAQARATRSGEVNIGTGNYSYGYNSTAYRVLGGVHDGVDAHDAATVGQVIGTTESYTIATTDWSALSSSSPYDYQATVTATYTIGNNTILELINDNPVSFANNGFAIGSVSSQSVTIYSIGQPSASVTLKVNYKG